MVTGCCRGGSGSSESDDELLDVEEEVEEDEPVLRVPGASGEFSASGYSRDTGRGLRGVGRGNAADEEDGPGNKSRPSGGSSSCTHCALLFSSGGSFA